MYYPRQLNVVRTPLTPLTPLTPIPAMEQSAFDFSPDAIARCMGSSNTPTIFESTRAFTPDNLLDMPRPNLSPIEFLLDISDASENNLVSPCLSANNWNSSFKNISTSLNINNRHLDISTILDDLKLREYSPIFNQIDLDVFLTLDDDELLRIGVENELHRETLLNSIATFNGNN